MRVVTLLIAALFLFGGSGCKSSEARLAEARKAVDRAELAGKDKKFAGDYKKHMRLARGHMTTAEAARNEPERYQEASAAILNANRAVEAAGKISAKRLAAKQKKDKKAVNTLRPAALMPQNK